MDRDSNDIIASQIMSYGVGGSLFLFGLSMIIWSWGPGFIGGLPLMLGGVCYPLFKAYQEQERKKDSERRKKGRSSSSQTIEIRTKNYRGPRLS
jgi:hypothetical protein